MEVLKQGVFLRVLFSRFAGKVDVRDTARAREHLKQKCCILSQSRDGAFLLSTALVQKTQDE